MYRLLRHRPSPALVVSIIALVAATGGIAAASIPDGSGKITACYLNSYATAPGSASPVYIVDTASTSCPSGYTPVSWGQQGPKGDTGPAGTARAYGKVVGTTVSRSKNVTGVTNPKPGLFCIALATGIDASQTGVVVTPDFDNSASGFNVLFNSQPNVEWISSAAQCAAGQLEVITRLNTLVTATSPDGDVHEINTDTANQGFFFMVP